jgi:response regulator RpfG family c-di-GMP phosphodiesterase
MRPIRVISPKSQTMQDIVLIVDDDSNLLYGLKRVLNKQPYMLLTCRSGDDAMLILKTREVGVLVADEKMPGVTGCDLLAWAAENVPDTVRIMLTGNATKELAIRTINEGRVHHFFTKPCDDVQLAIVIRKSLEDRAALIKNRRLAEVNRDQADYWDRFLKYSRLLAQTVDKDIRVPFNKIDELCSAAVGDNSDGLDPQVKALSRQALEAVEEARHILDKLLENPLIGEEIPCSWKNRS